MRKDDPTGAEICSSLQPHEEVLVREIIARVSDKWSLWALAELVEEGPLRFSRLLERVTGISQKSLTVALRQLERDGFVTRTVIAQVPIRVDYAATHTGRAFIDHVDPLWTWVAGQIASVEASRARFDAAMDT